jgi:hypothetical protein
MIKLSQSEAREKRHNPWYCKVCRKLVYISYSYYMDMKDFADYEVPYKENKSGPDKRACGFAFQL